MRLAKIARLLREQRLQHTALGFQRPAGPRLGVGSLADRSPRVVQVTLEGLDLAKPRRGDEELRQPIALPSKERDLVFGPGQIAGEHVPSPRNVGESTVDVTQ